MPVNRKDHGFALVIALSLMAFVLLLLLSMTTLVRVETQSSKQVQQIDEARANAMLGLQVALGELQVAAGPDQRVTATGSLWATPQVGTEHLVGVWNSDIESPDYGQFVRWLVSRQEPAAARAITLVDTEMPVSVSGNTYFATDDNYVMLVAAGSTTQDASRPTVMQGVVAEKVAVFGDRGIIGNFAWWVGDEGVKATVNKVDPYTGGVVPQETTSWAGLDEQWKHLSLLSSQGTNLGVLEDFQDISVQNSSQSENLSKIQTMQALEFVDFLSTDRRSEVIKRSFHTLTTTSYGLQTDVSQGGLKRDLSLLFEMSDSDYYAAILPLLASEGLVYTEAPGPQSELPLLFTAPAPTINKTIYGPTLDMLRDYYRLYKGVTSKNSAPQLGPDWVHTYFPGKAWLNQVGGYGQEQAAWGQSLGALAWRHEGAVGAPEANKQVSRSGEFISPQLDSEWNVIRPTKGAYVPYLNRFTLFMSVESKAAASGNGWDVNVVMQPFIAIHNPYNVELSAPRMRFLTNVNKYEVVARRGPDPSAVPGDVNSEWRLDRPFRSGKGGDPGKNDTGNIYKHPEQSSFLRLKKGVFTKDGASPKAFNIQNNPELEFRIPATVFEPGEVKLFVAGSRVAIQGGARELEMVELSQYQTDYGIDLELDSINMWVDHDDAGSSPKQQLLKDVPFGSELMVKLRSETWFDFAFEVFNLELGAYDTGGSYSHRASHIGPYGNNDWSPSLQDLIDADLSSYEKYTHRIEIYEGNPTPSAALDVFLKPMDFGEAIYSDSSSYDGVDYLTTQSLKAFPNFMISNPLAASFSRSGVAGRFEFNGLGNMFHSSSEKFHRDYSSNQDLIQKLNDGDAGTWGGGIGSLGNKRSVILEIPIAPMQSMGQFQHASLSASQFTPALSIGHSTPSPYVESFEDTVYDFTETYFSANREWVFYDQNYLANEALWDSYFFSSIAPRPNDSAYSRENPASQGDPFAAEIPAVVDDFMSGVEGLANSRVRLASLSADDTQVREELLNFSNSAGHLLVDGAFNINSTSEAAWTAFLSAYRDTAILYSQDGNLRAEVLSGSSALMRQSISGGPSVSLSSASVSDDASWAGFSELSDADILALAQSIVAEVKGRSEERARLLGTTAPTPALSIGSFVNRLLTTNDSYNQAGTLQAAIENTSINDNLLSASTDFNTAQIRAVRFPGTNNNYAATSEYPNPDYTINSAMVSPVSLNQANILQAVAPAMSARSDTFKIRSYGESIDVSGTINRAWCEATVQRMVNHRTTGDARQFEVLNFRWLSPDDV